MLGTPPPLPASNCGDGSYLPPLLCWLPRMPGTPPTATTGSRGCQRGGLPRVELAAGARGRGPAQRVLKVGSSQWVRSGTSAGMRRPVPIIGYRLATPPPHALRLPSERGLALRFGPTGREALPLASRCPRGSPPPSGPIPGGSGWARGRGARRRRSTTTNFRCRCDPAGAARAATATRRTWRAGRCLNIIWAGWKHAAG